MTSVLARASQTTPAPGLSVTTEQPGKTIILRNGVRAVVLYGCGHFCYGEHTDQCWRCSDNTLGWQWCSICGLGPSTYDQQRGRWEQAGMPAQMKIGETNDT